MDTMEGLTTFWLKRFIFKESSMFWLEGLSHNRGVSGGRHAHCGLVGLCVSERASERRRASCEAGRARRGEAKRPMRRLAAAATAKEDSEGPR
jgi:hypothetical protein